jgi:predicted amidohydrolase
MTLLKARAIENQTFFIGVNRIGTDGNGVKYSKSSMCFDPYGQKVKQIRVKKELDIVDINLAIIDEYRLKLTTLKDKRFTLYKNLFLG